MPDSTLMYLIINNSFVLAGAIVAMFRSSNCSRLLCGQCLEVDNLQHEPTIHTTTNDIIAAQSQIHNPQMMTIQQ